MRTGPRSHPILSCLLPLTLLLSGCDLGGLLGGDNGKKSSCNGAARITGVVNTSVAPIDYSGETVTTQTGHKVDIDAYEDRCISTFEMSLYAGSEGCRLDVLFTAEPTNSNLTVANAKLAADSMCSGWSDQNEGNYEFNGNGDLFVMMPSQVPDEMASTSCFSSDIVFGGTMELVRSDGAVVTVNLNTLTVSGSFVSQGDTELVCPNSQSANGQPGDVSGQTGARDNNSTLPIPSGSPAPTESGNATDTDDHHHEHEDHVHTCR